MRASMAASEGPEGAAGVRSSCLARPGGVYTYLQFGGQSSPEDPRLLVARHKYLTPALTEPCVAMQMGTNHYTQLSGWAKQHLLLCVKEAGHDMTGSTCDRLTTLAKLDILKKKK